jgi:hypothetical protein
MPHPVTLLPCEKVVVDRDGIPTLIALFENINLAPVPGKEIVEVPKETITFQQWAVFCEWEIAADELGLKAADQIFEIQFPDGSIAPIKGEIPFVFGNPGIHRNHQSIVGFPVGQEGTYHIRVWLEKDGKPISDVGTREMKVFHSIPTGKMGTEIFGQSPKP